MNLDDLKRAASAAGRASLRWLKPKRLGLLILAALAIDWAVTGISVVREDERAVVLRFGRAVRVAPAGILFSLPWPFERVITLTTTEVRTMPVGYKMVDAVRGIPPAPEEVEWVTGDTNIIDLTLTIKYTISDPVEYLFRVGPVDADFLVRKCAETTLTRLIATMPVDELLTSGKIRVQDETRRGTQALLDELEAGIHVVTVNIGDIEPPADVIEAFNDVSTAKLEKAKLINEADGYRKDLIPKARAMADRMIKEAQIDSARTVNLAKGEVSEFLDLLAEARKSRSVTETRIYLESMQRILSRPRIIVVDPRSTKTVRVFD